MKKILIVLALLCTKSWAQEEHHFMYNGPECGMDYNGINATYALTPFHKFLEQRFGIEGFSLFGRDEKFDYEASTVFAQCQRRMHTFDEVDLSTMGTSAKRTLSQTLRYEDAVAGIKQHPNKIDTYDRAFFDNFEFPEIKKRDKSGTLLDRCSFAESITSKWKEGTLMVMEKYKGDSVKYTGEILTYLNNFTFDTTRNPVIEKAWWYDEGTGQFECYVVSIMMPAFLENGESTYLYVFFPNYFLTKSEYTSLNGTAVPINYAIIEDLIPHGIGELMPDSFYIKNEWNRSLGRNPEKTNAADFQAPYQMAEFLMYQRRNVIFGRGHDTIAERRFEYSVDREGKAQGKVSKFYRNGKTLYNVHFKDGKPNGKYECFYSGGGLSETGSFDGGRRHGRWVSYYENGAVKADRFYKNGTKDSVYRTFYENGEQHEKYTFLESGNRLLERKYDDGSLMEKGEINENNKAVGLWEYNIKFKDDFAEWVLDPSNLWKKRCWFENTECTMIRETKSVRFKVAYKQGIGYINAIANKYKSAEIGFETEAEVIHW